MEEKIDLKFSEREISYVSFGEQKIQVKSYLDITNKNAILDAYFADRELSPVESHLEAELNLILNVINMMTNIKVNVSDNEKATKFVNDLLNTGAWYKVKSAIVNFAELSRDIERISQQKSLESKVNIIADKVITLIDNISKLDMSPEGIKAMVEQIGIGKEKLAEVFLTIVDKPLDAPTP